MVGEILTTNRGSEPVVGLRASLPLGSFMRICKLTLCLLPALAFGCAQFRRAGTPGSDVLISFPDHLRQGDQVVGFELHIRNGTILAVDKVPHDWVIRLLAEWPGSEMSGEPNHGASAFQDMIQ